MSIAGALITLFAGLFYSLRFSYVKDLGKFHLSKISINFYYRLISLPIIIGILLLSGEKLLDIKSNFLLWFSVALFVNTAFGLYQVYSFQKHDFSSIESLSFLEIFFTSVTGLILFNEVLTSTQMLGIGIIIVAFLLLLFFGSKGKSKWSIIEIIFYYSFTSVLNLVNKQAINTSSPLLYIFYLTFGLTIIFLILSVRDFRFMYKLDIKQANKLLIIIGIIAAVTFICVSYGYKLLPVGIVSALISLKVFISLWLSYRKYGEKNLLSKIMASVIAVIGTVVLFM